MTPMERAQIEERARVGWLRAKREILKGVPIENLPRFEADEPQMRNAYYIGYGDGVEEARDILIAEKRKQ